MISSMELFSWRIASALLLTTTFVQACSAQGDSMDLALTRAVVSTSTTTTTTTVPTTTTTTLPLAPPPPDGLGRGAEGEAVLALERRLITLQFDPGDVDGIFDASTGHAVMAFQKLHGLERTSRATTAVIEAMNTAGLPASLVPGADHDRVEVDLPRQVLIVWKNGAVFRVVDVSTGNNRRYCVEGECGRAVTPGGSYRISRRINGWRKSRLGMLYNPLYFNGGIAIHGAPSVPAGPASHGCVRIPMYISKWFPDQVPNGTPVYVLDGTNQVRPFTAEELRPTTTTSSTSSTSSTSTTSTSTTTTTRQGIFRG
jgi:hypothetical protein